MAMPRKNWFKVPDSVAFDDLTNDELACLIRLQAYMNTRWARDGKAESERGRCTISPSMAKQISGKHRADIAATSLRHLADIAAISVRYDGEVASIEWPKYAEFQETASRELPPPISKTSPSQDFTKKEEKRSEAPSAPPAPRAPRERSKTLCPDSLPEPEWSGVLRWAQANGFSLVDVPREWEAHRDYWQPERKMRSDWSASFRTWLRNAKRFAARDARLNGAMSPAQAKAERTKDAGRQAYELLQQRKLGLIEGGAA